MEIDKCNVKRKNIGTLFKIECYYVEDYDFQFKGKKLKLWRIGHTFVINYDVNLNARQKGYYCIVELQRDNNLISILIFYLNSLISREIFFLLIMK